MVRAGQWRADGRRRAGGHPVPAACWRCACWSAWWRCWPRANTSRSPVDTAARCCAVVAACVLSSNGTAACLDARALPGAGHRGAAPADHARARAIARSPGELRARLRGHAARAAGRDPRAARLAAPRCCSSPRSWSATRRSTDTGRTLGRHPLAPAISPKKTIEGAAGGARVRLGVHGARRRPRAAG